MCLSLHTARILSASIWSLLCLSTIAAPLLAACGYKITAGILYLLWSPFCHQDSQRSFMLFGHRMAVCHRCTGIYVGFFLAALVNTAWYRIALEHRRLAVFIAAIPLLLDAMLPLTGLWSGSTWTRIATGLIFGMAASSYLVIGIAELLCENVSEQPGMSISNKTREAFYER